MSKSWHEWEPDGPDQGSVLREIARHMKNGWEHSDNPASTDFKVGHRLAYRGWKFGSGVVDLADGSGVSGIKALRALIIAGRYDWFERAAAMAPGDNVTPADAPRSVDRDYLLRLSGLGTPLSRFHLPDADIWMLAEPAGWRVASVFVHDASASGLKDALLLATTKGGGCLTLLIAIPGVIAALAVAFA